MVQYIGADNYCYQIDIVKPGFSKCKVILSDYCHGIERADEELFQEGHCVFLPLEALRRYTGDDEVLVYYVRVNELNEDRNAEIGRAHQQKGAAADGVGDGKERPRHYRDRSKNPPHLGKKFTLPKKKK